MPLDSYARTEMPVAVPFARPELGPISFLSTMRRNLLELLPEAAYHQPVVSGRTFRRWHMLMDPPSLEHVLKTNEKNYPRSDVTRRIVKPSSGESVFYSYGAAWRRQHKAVAPAFQPRGVRSVAPIMTEHAELCAMRLSHAVGSRIDMHAEMTKVTCDIICDAALSGREALDRDGLIREVGNYLTSISRVSVLDLLGAPSWVPRPARLRDRSGPAMDRMVEAIVRARLERGPSATTDVLDMLIEASRIDDSLIGSREIRNNLIAFLIAGHETSSLALTWALYLVAYDRDVQARARRICADALGPRAATYDDLPALGYVRQILEEAMRLYPPGGLMTRTAQADDLLPVGVRVERGDTIILPVYALHRHRALWDEPDVFDPDRFEPARAKARHRYAYLPFSAGPRICVGMGFAMAEMTIVLATLLARFELRLPDGFRPLPEMLLTIRPTGGMPLCVRPIG
jgi:cytochrome P450